MGQRNTHTNDDPQNNPAPGRNAPNFGRDREQNGREIHDERSSDQGDTSWRPGETAARDKDDPTQQEPGNTGPQL